MFVDAGEVAHTVGDLALRSFVTNYGIGLRLHSNSKFWLGSIWLTAARAPGARGSNMALRISF